MTRFAYESPSELERRGLDEDEKIALFLRGVGCRRAPHTLSDALGPIALWCISFVNPKELSK